MSSGKKISANSFVTSGGHLLEAYTFHLLQPGCRGQWLEIGKLLGRQISRSVLCTDALSAAGESHEPIMVIKNVNTVMKWFSSWISYCEGTIIPKKAIRVDPNSGWAKNLKCCLIRKNIFFKTGKYIRAGLSTEGNQTWKAKQHYREFLNFICKQLEGSGNHVRLLFLDLSSAFNNTQPQLMVKKVDSNVVGWTF